MNSRERFLRILKHQEADRVPMWDSPWGTTLDRWHDEGLPKNVPWEEYFGLDTVMGFGINNSPRFEEKILEETDEYIIRTSSWGATMRSWKHNASTPDFLDFKLKTKDDWEEFKERMQPTEDRVDYKDLKERSALWDKRGALRTCNLWFGFDVTHSWTMGTAQLLMQMAFDPEWCKEIFNHYLDVQLTLLDKIWDNGIRFDLITWPDDMGYKNSTFFSLDMYRELLKPVQKRAVDWAHNHDVLVRLHSCGNVNTFIPDLIEIGIDCLNPLEVKAGMNPVELKEKYGQDLTFHGGVNAMLFSDKKGIADEIRRLMPIMKKDGGYIFASDHSIPESVSLSEMQNIVDVYKECAQY